jgi:hypothetical protein
LNDVSLNLRRTFDDASRPRMTKRSSEKVILAQARRARNFQGEVYYSMQKLCSEEFDIRRLSAHVQFLVRFPRAEVSERPQGFGFAEKMTDPRSPSIAGILIVPHQIPYNAQHAR